MLLRLGQSIALLFKTVSPLFSFPLFLLFFQEITTMPSFTQKVFAVVAKIPKGETLSYKQVAKKAGSPLAYRAVGNILNKNYNKNIPCHRVVRSDGTPGGYNRGGEKAKNKILELEKRQAFDLE